MRVQLTHILELSDAEHISVRAIPFALESFAGTRSEPWCHIVGVRGEAGVLPAHGSPTFT